MAHFAELEEKTDPTGFTTDTHLVVKRVIVVDNAHVPSDEHVDGETWCSTFFKGGTWKQTSYNNNFRKQYAGIGYIYDAAKNKFLNPQPYASWSLGANDDWKAPVTYPTITTYGDPEKKYHIGWDEDNLQWTAQDSEEPQNSFNWDASGLTWVSA
jgi:hypothetical protein